MPQENEKRKILEKLLNNYTYSYYGNTSDKLTIDQALLALNELEPRTMSEEEVKDAIERVELERENLEGIYLRPRWEGDGHYYNLNPIVVRQLASALSSKIVKRGRGELTRLIESLFDSHCVNGANEGYKTCSCLLCQHIRKQMPIVLDAILGMKEK